MRTILRRIGLAAVALGVVVSTVRCTFWGNGDNNLPILDDEQSLGMSPSVYVFPIVPDSIDAGPSEATFTISARTRGGLGAESVSVVVRIVTDAAQKGIITVDHEIISRIQLAASPDAGCVVESPQQLRCILSDEGLAHFLVRASHPLVSTNGQAIALNVTPIVGCPDAGGGTNEGAAAECRPGQSLVLIADGLDGGRLGISPADAEIPPLKLAESATCSSLIAACSGVIRPLPVTLTLLDSTDASALAQQPLDVSVVLEPADTSSGIYLSASSTCPTTDVTKAEVTVSFAPGSAIATPAYVCAGGRGGTFQLRARAINQPALVGVSQLRIAAQPAKVNLAVSATGLDAGKRVGTVAATLVDCQQKEIGDGFLALSPQTGAPVALTRLDAAAGTNLYAYELPADAGTIDLSVSVPSSGQTCPTTLEAP